MRNRLMLLMLAFWGVLSVFADSREDFMADFVKGDRFYQNNASREEFFNLTAFLVPTHGGLRIRGIPVGIPSLLPMWRMPARVPLCLNVGSCKQGLT